MIKTGQNIFKMPNTKKWIKLKLKPNFFLVKRIEKKLVENNQIDQNWLKYLKWSIPKIGQTYTDQTSFSNKKNFEEKKDAIVKITILQHQSIGKYNK